MLKIRRRAFVRVRRNDIYVSGAQLDIARMTNVEVRPIDGNALLREYPVANNPVHIAVKCAPTLDTVPVVRCRECKHWGYGIPGDDDETRVCVENAEIEMPCDGFCHKGKRRCNK